MHFRTLLPAAALIGAIALAAPVAAGADPGAPAAAPDICGAVQAEGPMAVLGPYGPLGDYGPGGSKAGQANPATACGGASSFALPGFTPGSFVIANLSLAGQSTAGVAP
jgi:hypothetical protein